MRWAGHVSRRGEERSVCGVVVGKPEGKRPLAKLRLIECMILKYILENYAGRGWAGLIWLRIGTNGRPH
jgi:hypothetical protein